MSGGGVENHWRLDGGMDILFYFIYLLIYFYFFIFSSLYTGYDPLQFKVIIYLPAVTSSFS